MDDNSQMIALFHSIVAEQWKAFHRFSSEYNHCARAKSSKHRSNKSRSNGATEPTSDDHKDTFWNMPDYNRTEEKEMHVNQSCPISISSFFKMVPVDNGANDVCDEKMHISEIEPITTCFDTCLHPTSDEPMHEQEQEQKHETETAILSTDCTKDENEVDNEDAGEDAIEVAGKIENEVDNEDAGEDAIEDAGKIENEVDDEDAGEVEADTPETSGAIEPAESPVTPAEEHADEGDEEEGELFEVELDDVAYYIESEENGPIYAKLADDSVGEKVGNVVDGDYVLF